MFQVRSVIVVKYRSAIADRIDTALLGSGRGLECELPEEGIMLQHEVIYLYVLDEFT